MSAVVDISINLLSFLIVTWICVLFYFSVEEYMTGSECVVSKSGVSKTNNLAKELYLKAKEYISKKTAEPYEDRQLNPHEFDLSTGVDLKPEDTVTNRGVSEEVDEEAADDYNDVLLSQLEPVILEQHASYINGPNNVTKGVSMVSERSDRQDVVPQWGLRRYKYGKDLVSNTATSVPSFEYEEEKTGHTDLMKFLGA